MPVSTCALCCSQVGSSTPNRQVDYVPACQPCWTSLFASKCVVHSHGFSSIAEPFCCRCRSCIACLPIHASADLESVDGELYICRPCFLFSALPFGSPFKLARGRGSAPAACAVCNSVGTEGTWESELVANVQCCQMCYANLHRALEDSPTAKPAAGSAPVAPAATATTSSSHCALPRPGDAADAHPRQAAAAALSTLLVRAPLATTSTAFSLARSLSLSPRSPASVSPLSSPPHIATAMPRNASLSAPQPARPICTATSPSFHPFAPVATPGRRDPPAAMCSLPASLSSLARPLCTATSSAPLRSPEDPDLAVPRCCSLDAKPRVSRAHSPVDTSPVTKSLPSFSTAARKRSSLSKAAAGASLLALVAASTAADSAGSPEPREGKPADASSAQGPSSPDKADRRSAERGEKSSRERE
eukprot:CAMPEP_0177652114 /NCGR_PEP_ID=MMETSP0447-20121125/12932_1 /TAXON_ID=0 /ORGANISM="Stygamoeba regulata, Strain BSH-02190019" /LENGTH=417 /DNA_ID=CAMNT_0019155287 /DNA_START=390 /DNA_END=1640 /DNA_ORIENTATION=+